MRNLSKLFLAIAIASTVSASHAASAEDLASKRLSIQTEVTKDGKVVSTSAQEVINGGTAHFSDAKTKEIDHKVTVTCRTGALRWLQFYKPRCDEPVREVKNVAIGFNADVGAREAHDGGFIVFVKGSYVDVLSDNTIKGANADVRTASFRNSTLNSSAIIQPGEVLEITNGSEDGIISLKLSVTPL